MWIVELRRNPVKRNHTATHLLNFGLRSVLGDGVDQKGSLVAPDRLRFDFSTKKAMSTDEIGKVESIVVDQIKKNLTVYAKEATLTEARPINGLRAVFGEVYPDPVRVVSVGHSVQELLGNPTAKEWMNGSIEFCGGTHVATTGEIGGFTIISEESIAKGVRRIVAVSATESKKVIEEGERFEKKVQEIVNLEGAPLNAAVNTLRTELEASQVGYVQKDKIRGQLDVLKKKFDDADKAQKAAILEQVLFFFSLSLFSLILNIFIAHRKGQEDCPGEPRPPRLCRGRRRRQQCQGADHCRDQEPGQHGLPPHHHRRGRQQGCLCRHRATQVRREGSLGQGVGRGNRHHRRRQGRRQREDIPGRRLGGRQGRAGQDRRTCLCQQQARSLDG